jgi:hypothetical protein
MKGSPLLRAAWVVMLLVAVAWPVWEITHRTAKPLPGGKTTPTSASTSTTTPPSDQPLIHATLLLHGAPDPSACSILQQGRILLAAKDRIGPGEYRATADLLPGTDLLVSAAWRDRDPHALRLEVLVSDDVPPLQKDYWARETLEDAFAFPDSPPPCRP